MTYQSSSKKETINIGKQIASNFQAGDIILLQGELGAGKTVLAKGILENFGIRDVVSPTFTLMQVYDFKQKSQSDIKTIAHIDTYRLENEQELVDIGVLDYLGEDDTLCIIEWPEKIKELLVDKKIKSIKISSIGDHEREIQTTF